MEWNRTAIVEDRLNGPQGLVTIPPLPSTLKTTKKIVTLEVPVNGLALLHIHRDVNVDRVKILDKFDL